MADSQFVPEMDDYLDEVDPDAYLQVEQEMYEEADAMGASSQQQAGQGNPRRLDFVAYGSEDKHARAVMADMHKRAAHFRLCLSISAIWVAPSAIPCSLARMRRKQRPLLPLHSCASIQLRSLSQAALHPRQPLRASCRSSSRSVELSRSDKQSRIANAASPCRDALHLPLSRHRTCCLH